MEVNNNEEVVKTDGSGESNESVLVDSVPQHSDTADSVEPTDSSSVRDRSRHGYTMPFKDIAPKSIEDIDYRHVVMPTAPYTALLSSMYALDTFSPDVISNQEPEVKLSYTHTLEALNRCPDNGYYTYRDLKTEDVINTPKYGEKSYKIKELGLEDRKGELSSQAAMVKFAQHLGLGATISVPLWHSGFWVVLAPPKTTQLLNLTTELNRESIELGKLTKSLIYANESAIYVRIVAEFIRNQIVSTTLDIPKGKDLLDYISLHDLPILILGLLSCIFPKGLPMVIRCENNIVYDDAGKPLCDYIAEVNANTADLLILDRNALDKSMLEHMASRTPRSHSVTSVEEYQSRIAERTVEIIEYSTPDSGKVEIKLMTPTIGEYIRHSELWIQTVTHETEAIFQASVNKNEFIEKLLTTLSIGRYNTFIREITMNSDTYVRDPSTISELLNIISSDTHMTQYLFDAVAKFISKSYIAVPAMPRYKCEKCQSEQESTKGENAFEEFIPLNLLNTFFDLCALKANLM